MDSVINHLPQQTAPRPGGLTADFHQTCCEDKVVPVLHDCFWRAEAEGVFPDSPEGSLTSTPGPDKAVPRNETTVAKDTDVKTLKEVTNPVTKENSVLTRAGFSQVGGAGSSSAP